MMRCWLMHLRCVREAMDHLSSADTQRCARRVWVCVCPCLVSDCIALVSDILVARTTRPTLPTLKRAAGEKEEEWETREKRFGEAPNRKRMRDKKKAISQSIKIGPMGRIELVPAGLVGFDSSLSCPVCRVCVCVCCVCTLLCRLIAFLNRRFMSNEYRSDKYIKHNLTTLILW